MALRGSLQRLRYYTTICFLFCFFHGKMTAADISDYPVSQTEFPAVRCEVWRLFSSCFQRFQFGPNSSSQSVARAHIRGEHLLNRVLNSNCRLTEIVSVESITSSQAVSHKSGANTQQRFWDNPGWSSICPLFFSVVSLTGQWGHTQLLPESYPKGQVHRSFFFYCLCCGSFCLNESPDMCVYYRPTVSTTVRWPVITPLKRKGNSMTCARKTWSSVNCIREPQTTKI